jgi:16S rRNA (uracil1498-N3)-methyltransferase
MKKVHRFFVSGPLTSGEQAFHQEDLIHQLHTVLRLSSGEDIILFNEQGIEARATITYLDEQSLRATITAVSAKKETGRKVTLYAAILKGDHFDLAVEKAVETGVHTIVPIITDRTIKTGIKHERLERIAKEASEQCGRTYVPKIQRSISLKEAIASVSAENAVFFDPSGVMLETLISKLPSEIAVFVGPEGGWSDDELARIKEAGFPIASLGPMILRGETAVTVATYLSVHAH